SIGETPGERRGACRWRSGRSAVGVEPADRLDEPSADAHLEVEVVGGRAPGAAHESDQLPGLDGLPRLDLTRAVDHVAVERRDLLAAEHVVDDDTDAVAVVTVRR